MIDLVVFNLLTAPVYACRLGFRLRTITISTLHALIYVRTYYIYMQAKSSCMFEGCCLLLWLLLWKRKKEKGKAAFIIVIVKKEKKKTNKTKKTSTLPAVCIILKLGMWIEHPVLLENCFQITWSSLSLHFKLNRGTWRVIRHRQGRT